MRKTTLRSSQKTVYMKIKPLKKFKQHPSVLRALKSVNISIGPRSRTGPVTRLIASN